MSVGAVEAVDEVRGRVRTVPGPRVAAWPAAWLAPAAAPVATSATAWAVPPMTEDATEARTAAPIAEAVAQVKNPLAVSRKQTSCVYRPTHLVRSRPVTHSPPRPMPATV
jgi:hypothetical protein